MSKINLIEKSEFPETYRFFENSIFPPKFMTWVELQRKIENSIKEYLRQIEENEKLREELYNMIIKYLDIWELFEIQINDVDIDVLSDNIYKITIIPKIEKNELKLYFIIEE